MIATLYYLFGSTEGYSSVPGLITGLIVFLMGIMTTLYIYSIKLVDKKLDKNPTKKIDFSAFDNAVGNKQQGIFIGKVKDNTDPDGLGRLRVWIPQISSAKETDSTTPVNIITDGVAGGLSGLTSGSLYYISTNYDGTVSTDSTSGIFVGKAISATEILLQRSNTQ
jgi:hypothetical protein